MTEQTLQEELKQLLFSDELADAMGLTVKTVWNLKSEGVLVPRLLVGRRPKYDLAECLKRYNRMRGPLCARRDSVIKP